MSRHCTPTSYNREATPIATAKTVKREALTEIAAPVGLGMLVGWEAVGAEGVALEVPLTRAKLAQVMRVVLAKWTTMERLPKKAPMPERVEAKSSV